MEQQEQSNDFLSTLEVDYSAGNHLKEAVKWSSFIAITLIICCSLGLLLVIIGGLAFLGSSGSGGLNSTAFGGYGRTQIYLLIPMLGGIVYGSIMLYQFATQCRIGLNNQDQLAFNKGLKALRNYFIAYGVIVILGFISNLSQLFL